MVIKTWQKVLFVGSIGAFILYVNRQRVVKGGRYIKRKFSDLVNMFASKWVGVTEIGENQSFANDVFQGMMKNIGWRSTEAWCMYFAKAIHYEALKNNPTEQAKVNKILSGSTQLSYVKAKNDNTNTYTTSTTPKEGDIIIFQNTNDTSKGHAGIVVKVNNNNTVDTIEGNTSDKNIREGDIVARKNRTSVIGKSIGGNLVLRGFIRKLNV
jgi:surface antigen